MCEKAPQLSRYWNSNAEIIESLRALGRAGGICRHLGPYRGRSHLESLRRSAAMQGRQFVLTSANVERVRGVVGTDQMTYEIVGRPLDLDQIIRAIKEASKARPV